MKFTSLDKAVKAADSATELNLTVRATTRVSDLAKLTKLEVLVLLAPKMKVVPPEIFALASLRRLTLAAQLEMLPGSIAALPLLECLALARNSLTELPPEVGQLERLRELYLTANPIRALPEELGRLVSLERVVAQNLKIATLPNAVGALRSLVEFDLAGCPLETIPESIGELRSLRTLVMAGSRLTDLPAAFASLPQLESVTLNLGRFVTVPLALTRCSALRCVLLGQNGIEDITPIVRSPIMNANVEMLDLSVSPISRLTGIGAMQALQDLVLTNTLVADLSEVATLPNLRHLWVGRTPVTDSAVRAFRRVNPGVTVHR